VLRARAAAARPGLGRGPEFLQPPIHQRENHPTMRLHHAGLSVPDLERSLDWYCRAFALTEGYRFEVPAIGLRGVFALDPQGAGVELLEKSGALPGVNRADPPSANAVHGFNHVCFEVE